MGDGWIKLHRKIKYSPVFKDSALLHIWIYCLTEASHRGHKTLFGRREVYLQSGQFITGRQRAAMETGLTENQVRAGLKALQNLDMVKITTNQGLPGSIITVNNWQLYQEKDAPDNHQKATKLNPIINNGLSKVATKSLPSRHQQITKLNALTDKDLGKKSTKSPPSHHQVITTIQEGKERKEEAASKSDFVFSRFNWKRFTRKLGIDIPYEQGVKLNEAELAALVGLSKRSDVKNPLALAKYIAKTEPASKGDRRFVRAMLNPPPADGKCEKCGGKLEQQYAEGTGQTNYTCACGETYFKA